MTERERLNRATQDMIQNVKDCGQSLIANAASIVGNFNYQTDLDIHITIPVQWSPHGRG